MGSVHEDPKYQEGDPKKPEGLPDDVIISEDTYRDDRIPPGQSRTRKWPVLHATTVPTVSKDTWKLDVTGLVETPLSLDWEEFQKLPRIKVFADFHCVTQWSRLGNLWEGVSIQEIVKLTGLKPEAKFVLPSAYDNGWTTNIPIHEFLSEDVLLVDNHDGEPIDADHGGPVRLMVPKLYAWKSAKWIRGLEFSADDRSGYWERGGYHDYGDPWKEQRFQGGGMSFQI